MTELSILQIWFGSHPQLWELGGTKLPTAKIDRENVLIGLTRAADPTKIISENMSYANFDTLTQVSTLP